MSGQGVIDQGTMDCIEMEWINNNSLAEINSQQLDRSLLVILVPKPQPCTEF